MSAGLFVFLSDWSNFDTLGRVSRFQSVPVLVERFLESFAACSKFIKGDEVVRHVVGEEALVFDMELVPVSFHEIQQCPRPFVVVSHVTWTKVFLRMYPDLSTAGYFGDRGINCRS